MSKNVAVFVDVANLYYSARGQDVDVDYVALLKAATRGRDLIRAYAYSGLDPENENQRKFIDFLTKNGYKVVHKDIRKFGDGRMKANLDIELVVDLFRLQDRMDIAVVVSGDGDFAPAIRALQDVGVRCEVISFRPNTSSDLIAVADEFFDIMKIIDIGRKKETATTTARSRVMSAPEMPAKEVNPEFGFREASPHVAAAALAAIKGGGTRRTPRAAEVAPAPAVASLPDAEATAPAAGAIALDENGDAPRRRRRRGGRGRGRGRREDGTAEPTEAAEPAEVTWQELDDLSQLDAADDDLGAPQDRELTFSEADAATLAELGIVPEAVDTDLEAPVAAPAADETVPPTRRRRATTHRAAQPALEPSTPDAAATDTDASAAVATPARRRRSTKATEVASAAGGAGDAGATAPAQPRRTRRSAAAGVAPAAGEGAPVDEGPSPAAAPRRRRTSRASDAASAAGPAASGPAASDASAPPAESGASSAGEEPAQGIWQRFRSARPGR